MVNGDTDDPRELHAGTRQEGYLGGAWGGYQAEGGNVRVCLAPSRGPGWPVEAWPRGPDFSAVGSA